MIEIISHLTKMRFGEEEHNKAKDTKEVSSGGLCKGAGTRCWLACDCLFQPAGGIYSRLEAQFKSQTKSSDKIPRYSLHHSCKMSCLILLFCNPKCF